MNYIVIMAGGVGSRFWPSSRSHFPKQFLDVLGIGKSLLQMTFERFLSIVPAERILVVTNADYSDLVQAQLPQLPAENILGEPSRNNTAPCIAYAALRIQKLDPNASFVVAPSDHLIVKEAEFLQKIQTALDIATQQDALLTLGIQPTRPDTGYGYIHYAAETQAGAHRVHRFVEKPHLENAQRFVASGDYLWNAGIFIWNVKAILNAFQTLAPDIYTILSQGVELLGTSAEAAFLKQYYPTTPNISVDYAILEKAENVFTLPADIGWSDLGTWASLYEHLPQDAQGNAITNGGAADRVLCLDSANNLIRASKDKIVIVKDLENYIVVDEKDVLLIYPKQKEQEIKPLVQLVEKQFGPDYL